MKVRSCITLTLLLMALCARLHANDGAYYTSGNHLIPIVETQVSVQKEILKISRISDRYLQVDVYYEFYNPGNEKTILVGFEAPSPSGDVDGTPVNGGHPYMKDFTVNLNGQGLDFATAIVRDSNYYRDGAIQSHTVAEVTGQDFEPNDPDFYFVYHFDATFQKGLNKLKHTYTFMLSGSVDIEYDFHYILTAANRWANRQIDDFTLEIDPGDFQDFRIINSFFDSPSEWTLAGNGRIVPESVPVFYSQDMKSTRVFLQNGAVQFKRKNFHPRSELSVYAPYDFSLYEAEKFNHKEVKLPYSPTLGNLLKESADETSFKILRNWPFARRGYVFKTAAIREYYEKMDWYMPDPNYQSSLDGLTEEERKWLEEVKKNKY